MTKPYDRLQRLLGEVADTHREIKKCSHNWCDKREDTRPYQCGDPHITMDARIVFAIFRERTCVKCGLVQRQLEVTPGSPEPWKDAL